MTQYFLGIDIGSTNSRALIATDQGEPVGYGSAGAGNPEVVGYSGLQDVLVEITRKAIAAAEIDMEQIAGAGMGISGYDWMSQRSVTDRAIQMIGLKSPYEFVNDALLGLMSGATQGWGVAVVSGTGCNCWGWDSQHHIGHMTGAGWLLGEFAGASELAFETVKVISRAWSKRSPATKLTQALVDYYKFESEEALIEAFSTHRIDPDAEMAPLVFQAASEGDEAALKLVCWVGESLGDLANGVIRQLGIEKLKFEVIQTGSLYNGSPLLTEVMGKTIHRVAPKAELKRLDAPPVVGGVILGMEEAGFSWRKIRPYLVETAWDFIKRA